MYTNIRRRCCVTTALTSTGGLEKVTLVWSGSDSFITNQAVQLHLRFPGDCQQTRSRLYISLSPSTLIHSASCWKKIRLQRRALSRVAV